MVRVEAPEGFSVLMPKTPDVQRKSVPLMGLGEVHTVTMSATTNGALYSVTRAEYPEAAAKQMVPSKLLDDVRAGIVNEIKGTVSKQQDEQLLGYPGESFAMTEGNRRIRARSAVVGNQVFSLIVVYVEGAPQRADEFLDSLALGPVGERPSWRKWQPRSAA